MKKDKDHKKTYSHKKDEGGGEGKVKRKKNELEALKEKCEEYLSGWKRAQADYQNLKKESERQRQEFVKFANEGLILELLDVYSNYRLAFDHTPEDARQEGWMKGFEHVLSQMWTLLEAKGVAQIETEGKEFDPMYHEAVEDARKQETKESNDQKIKNEVQPGFTLHGRVIRPAKVVV